MHRRSFAECALALAALSVSSAAQNVFVVAPVLGPGVFSTSIQSAVNAASDGDIVLVRPGTYGTVSMAGKGISVVSDGTGVVLIFNANAFETPFNVVGLTSGQRVLLRGLTLRAGGDIPQPQPALRVVTADGSVVVVEECRIRADSTLVTSGQGLPGALLSGTGAVTMRASILMGASGKHGTAGNGMGGPAIRNVG